MNVYGYLKADLRRSICSGRFCFSVGGIMLLLWLASYETLQWRDNVVLSGYFILLSTPFLTVKRAGKDDLDGKP